MAEQPLTTYYQNKINFTIKKWKFQITIFSIQALEDAKELANVYYKNGFTDVEAKSGQHHGTYKVFVNFTPIADITYLPKEIFQSIKKESIRVGGILYAPPNYLRMGMFLELSRPAGDISRWEKVLKRITLLNKHYPLTTKNCDEIDFQREFENENGDEIYETVKTRLLTRELFFWWFRCFPVFKIHAKEFTKTIETYS